MEESTPQRETAPVKAPAKRKAPRGRPFTKENAKQWSATANQVKRLRAKARAEIVHTMVEKLNLGEEMVKAFKAHDFDQMALIEKALKLVGLDYAASDEARTQNVKVDAKTKNENKNSNTVHFIIDDAKPEDAE